MRHLSVSLGEGGLVPRAVSDVWATGYGDCKDSSVVFVALARLCGLDAVPALISTGRGPALKSYLPSATVFDHCLARVTLDWNVGETDVSIQIKGAVYSERVIKTDRREFDIDQELAVRAPLAPASEAQGYAQLARAMNDTPALILTGPYSGDKFTKSADPKKAQWRFWIWFAVVVLYAAFRILSLDREPPATPAGPEPAPQAQPLPPPPDLEIKDRQWLRHETDKPDQPDKPKPRPN